MRLRDLCSVVPCVVLAACFTAAAEDGGTNECLNQPDGVDCSTGLCCGQVCSTFQSDPNNCGTCGFSCPNEETCSGGVCIDCTRLPDGTACNGSGYKGLCCTGACVNPLSDHNNCGGCGDDGDAGFPAVCGIGQYCADAGCVDDCVGAADNIICSIVTIDDGNCCSGVCTNPDTDSDHCYLCNIVCSGGKTCQDALCQ